MREGREREHKQQRGERRLLARVLAAEFDANPRGGRLGREDGLHVGHHGVERAVRDAGRHLEHLLLVFTEVLAEHVGLREVRERGERGCLPRLRGEHGKRAESLLVEAYGIVRAHADADLGVPVAG